jgi:hypothetical protein
MELPWFVDQTVAVTFFCPWSNRDVTVRYLARPGLPPTLIGCDDRTCALSCLGEPIPAEPIATPR